MLLNGHTKATGIYDNDVPLHSKIGQRKNNAGKTFNL